MESGYKIESDIGIEDNAKGEPKDKVGDETGAETEAEVQPTTIIEPINIYYMNSSQHNILQYNRTKQIDSIISDLCTNKNSLQNENVNYVYQQNGDSMHETQFGCKHYNFVHDVNDFKVE